LAAGLTRARCNQSCRIIYATFSYSSTDSAVGLGAAGAGPAGQLRRSWSRSLEAFLDQAGRFVMDDRVKQAMTVLRRFIDRVDALEAHDRLSAASAESLRGRAVRARKGLASLGQQL
jgi:hypothetical protein